MSREISLKFSEQGGGDWSWYTSTGDTDHPDCYGGAGSLDPRPLHEQVGRALTALLQDLGCHGVFVRLDPDGNLVGIREELPSHRIITPEAVQPRRKVELDWKLPPVRVTDNNSEGDPWEEAAVWAHCGPYACHAQQRWATGFRFWGFRDAADDYLDYMNPDEVPAEIANALISALLVRFDSPPPEERRPLVQHVARGADDHDPLTLCGIDTSEWTNSTPLEVDRWCERCQELDG